MRLRSPQAGPAPPALLQAEVHRATPRVGARQDGPHHRPLHLLRRAEGAGLPRRQAARAGSPPSTACCPGSTDTRKPRDKGGKVDGRSRRDPAAHRPQPAGGRRPRQARRAHALDRLRRARSRRRHPHREHQRGVRRRGRCAQRHQQGPAGAGAATILTRQRRGGQRRASSTARSGSTWSTSRTATPRWT